jgi:AcrR family transcriptional regulator
MTTVQRSGRREAILDGALRAFTARGVSGTTVEDVRRLSGASVGSIYHHFGGKEELATALYVEALRSYQRGLLAALRRERDAERGIKAIVRHHLRWVAAHPDIARFLFARRDDDERVREVNRETFAATAAWLEPHMEAGRIRRLSLSLVHAVVLGPSQELSRHWLHGDVETSIRQAERALAEAAWRAVAGEGG